MIKGINSSSPYLIVQGGNPIQNYFSPGAQGAGQMRYNTNTNNVEVWDGVTWKEIATSYASVDLNYEAQSLLEWARNQRDRQQALEQRIAQNPALKKAFESVVRAQENFDMLDKIVGDDLDAELREITP
jgi:hypothetical protein